MLVGAALSSGCGGVGVGAGSRVIDFLRARMGQEFCTVFDVNYMPRGLVLYDSLRGAFTDFRLHVLCMDTATRDVLGELALPSLVPVSIEELEADDPALAAVRHTRSPVEYCWTAVASFCLFCLGQADDIDRITYLDADMRFYAPVSDELAGGSIVIVPHRHADRWRWLERDSGPYNVQLVSFRRDRDGVEALRRWRRQCIEWCYDRVEEGRYGDQRYLDDWPARFSNVRVLHEPGAGLAAWSSTRFRLELHRGRILVEGRPLLFYHFHGLRIVRRSTLAWPLDRATGARRLRIAEVDAAWASDFPLTPFEAEVIWRPYVEEVTRQTERVAAIVPSLTGLVAPAKGSFARRAALRAPSPLPALLSRALRAIPRGTVPVPATSVATNDSASADLVSGRARATSDDAAATERRRARRM
jgi:hypothetical protein